MSVEHSQKNRMATPIASPAFAVSVFAALLAGVLALWIARSPTISVLLGLGLVVGFTLIASRLGASSPQLAAGLLAGASLFTGMLVLFDWSLGMPAASPLTLESFANYLSLYRDPAFALSLATPLLTAVVGFAAGLALVKLLPPRRRATT